jgi:hypothetical protein
MRLLAALYKANFDDTAIPNAWIPVIKCILAGNIPAGL